VKSATTVGRRTLKTVVGLAVALVIGVLPLQKLLTSASTEAFVNAPVITVAAPAAGYLRSDGLAVGAHVERDQVLGIVAGDVASPLLSPTTGKVWEIMVGHGDRVAAGQPVLRVVGCAAASISAAVSETVYDQLRPGTPARFNFYGDDTFYYGTIANLFGHAAPTGDLAISPASLARDAFRVVVSLPALGTIPDCAVGRRGEVVFNPPMG
jgi:multidrug resistance efflux pump